MSTYAIYMKLGNIQGNVTLSEYSGWIKLLSVQFARWKFIQQPPTASSIALMPNIKEITCAKLVDASSGSIFQLLVTGKHVDAELSFVEWGGVGALKGYLKEYLRCEMKVVVSSFYNGSEGLGNNIHVVTNNFTLLCVNSIKVILQDRMY
mgnify:CR=1 FL=1